LHAQDRIYEESEIALGIAGELSRQVANRFGRAAVRVYHLRDSDGALSDTLSDSTHEFFTGHSKCACIRVAALLLVFVPKARSAEDATGKFEVYCDGGGFFLAKVDGLPCTQRTHGKMCMSIATGARPTENAKSLPAEGSG